MRFAVLASGNGTNLQAIISAVKSKKIKAQLGLVVSDKKKAYVLTRALKAGIPVTVVDPKKFKTREAFDKAVIRELKDFKIDFIVLAGYMRILSPYFVKAYKGKILNIHPALLPSFKGAHAIKDAFDYGAKLTGVTVHFVDEKVDHGPIILQEPVIIRPQDTLKTLESRIHKLEHKLYPKAIQLFSQGRLKIFGRKIILR
ncbi:MAG: phosphoribosylglycinamide formyltransferase [Candidatus Aceula meridiana]|nr:phosphoribosylglycinamide formyltransferase [Candidatus Aceula meridiana]